MGITMKAVEFLRVSTQEQGDDDRAGIPRQKAANALTIQKHQLTIIKTITILDVSGTSVLQTPEIKDLLILMHSGAINGVVTADWDRLIRLDNFNDFALLQHFKDTKTLVYLPDQVIDLNTQSGFLIGGFQSIISGNELTQIKKRMLEAKEAKRKNGEHPNCKITLPKGVGYNRAEKRFYYTDEIKDIKELFRLFHDEGIQNYMELQRQTNIQHRTIANLLRNELYIGYRTYTQKRGPEKYYKADGRQSDRKKIKRSPDEIIRIKVIDEPAIPEHVFNKIQDIIKTKNREYHKKRSKPGDRFLYSGFLRCGHCGDIMYTTSGGRDNRKDYYYCRSKNYTYIKKNGPSKCKSGYLQKKTVEHTITSFVADKLTEPKYLHALIKLALSESNHATDQHRLDELTNLIKKTEQKKAKILDLYGDGLFTRVELDNKVSELNDIITTAKSKITQLEQSAILKSQIINEQTIEPIIHTLTEFKFWTPDQKRTFLRSQIPEFKLSKQGLTGFTLNFCKSGSRTDKDSWPQ